MMIKLSLPLSCSTFCNNFCYRVWALSQSETPPAILLLV